MPPTVLMALDGLEALIQAEPQIASVVSAVKNLITGLFGAGIITADQQNALHARIDAVAAAAQAGQVLPEWTVEPDPPADPVMALSQAAAPEPLSLPTGLEVSAPVVTPTAPPQLPTPAPAPAALPPTPAPDPAPTPASGAAPHPNWPQSGRYGS